MSALLAAESFARAAADVFATLLERMHPAWAQAMGFDKATLAAAAGGSRGLRAVWAEAVAVRLDLRWPDVSAATEPLHLLWLLAPAQIERVCSARALFACRDALARSVDASVRRSARALVGPAAFEALVAVPAQRTGSAAGLGEVESGFTGVNGFALLQAGSRWADSRAQRLVQLVLPPLQLATEPPAACEAEHALFARHFSTLFPEHAWLFGSNPAHTTSV
jgi:hypothetical protein